MFNHLKRSILAMVFVTGVSALGQELSQSTPSHRHSIMQVSLEWMQGHQARRQALPFHPQATAEEYYASTSESLTLGDTLGVNFAADMNFTSCGGVSKWNQGSCGNCWVWGCTAASSASYGLASATPQLFSVQWFDSDYYATTQNSACNGGDSSTFASWYNSHPKFIPWSNTNAGYADSSGPSTPAVAASSISQSPSVSITSMSVSQIVTHGVTQAQAIANIKAALNAGHPVAFSFYLPGAGWTDFETAWDNDSETTPWANVDKYSGTAYDANAGGHLVCIVGYDNTNSSWVALNSWGTTSLRPDGFFEIPQAMGYGDTMTYSGSSFYQFEFDVLNISGWPTASALAISTQPSSQTVTAGGSVTFSVAATGGTSPYTYQWYKNGTAISGATAASYAFTTASSDTGATFYVKVTDSASTPATVTSNTATLTVNQVVGITVSPASVTLTTGGTQQFTATVTGTTNTAVTWSAAAGTISSAGLCTAPSTATSYNVIATSVADTTKSASALVTVSTSVLTISTQPSSQTVTAGASVTFSGSATGGTSPYSYQWYKNSTAIAGATSATYAFTTSSSDGGATFYVTVTDSASTPATVTSNTVTLTVNQAVGLSVSPTSVSLTAGGTQQFSATVTGTTNTAVTWSATGGTISSSGLYTAPATAGTYTVKVVSSADSSKSASATITVSASSTTQLIQNPGFESGAANWRGTTSDIGSWAGESAHGGSHYCWLNGYGRRSTEYIQQTVTIPSTVSKATLTFWLHIDTAETTKTVAYDTMTVQVMVGTTTTMLGTYSNLNSTSGYSQKTFDLTAYKGKTVTLRFLGVENNSLQTSFVIDDVDLNLQ